MNGDATVKTAPETEPEAEREPGEYLDGNGVPHCAVCGEPLRGTLDMALFGGPKTFVLECGCRRAAREKQAREQRLRERRGRARSAWSESRFYRPGLTGMSFDRDDSPEGEASCVCRNYADNWERMKSENCGLLLMGPVGTGKTFYAAAIMNRLIDRGVTCVMVSAPQLASAAMNGQSEEIMRELARCELVILDDLGAERDTDYALEQLELLADVRYTGGKPLIVTTNLTKAELDDQSDRRRVRIYDRVRELACVPVLLTGPSRRGASGRDKARRMRALLGA